MKKDINIEIRRSENENLGFATFEYWKPRLIVWPTFDGKTKSSHIIDVDDDFPDDIADEWGCILSKTMQVHSLNFKLLSIAANQNNDGKLDIIDPSSGIFKSIFSKIGITIDRKIQEFPLTAKYFNMCATRYYGYMHFLIRGSSIQAGNFDMKTALSNTSMLFKLGTEEPVLEIYCFEFENEFIETLKNESSKFRYNIQFSQIPFASAWGKVQTQ